MPWQIGVSTGCCVDRPIGDVIESLQGSRVRGVEIGTPPRHFDPWRREEISAVREQLDRQSIAAVSIHAPFGGLLDLSDPNPHHRHAAVGAVLTAAAAVHDLGGSIVVVHTSDVERNSEDVERRLECSRQSLQVIAALCARMNLTLAVESPLPHLVGGHPDEFEWLLKRLAPSVRVCLDTGHTTLGRHWRRFVDMTAERLVHVHANDHHGRFDDHLPPGDGSIDWKEITDSLRSVRFEGWIMLELGCPAVPLPVHFERAFEQAERLLAFA